MVAVHWVYPEARSAVLGSTATTIAHHPAGGIWSTATPPTGCDVGEFQLAVDKTSGVHMVYECTGTAPTGSADLRYLHKSPDGSWEWETVTGVVRPPRWLAVDSTGSVHLQFFARDEESMMPKVLTHAFRSPQGTWTLAPVPYDEPGQANGSGLCATLDEFDRVHTGYEADEYDGMIQSMQKYAQIRTCP